MKTLAGEINGTAVEFVSASHLSGDECLFVGRSGETVQLFESDDAATRVSTPAKNFATFVEGAKDGVFDHLT
jgi:hypothetical protein